MSARGWRSAQLAGVAAMGLMLVACGNDTKPSGGGAPAGTPTLTPSISGLPSTNPSGGPPKPSPLPPGSLSRNFTTELDASGGQWLTRYADAKAARAAYDKIIKTIKSCKAAVPAPTHARKLTENRTLPLGDATQLLRWYDYPLPSDPGSEDGGFPSAITLQGRIVSVLSFREMGPGIKPANFDRITRTAAAHLA
ncbi:hypothetical protein [Kribbella catacumbae]|uniref:hypothetical protein n=1 Tax=Kribbella catacumbae TaxID=460086 RepID=UPI0012F800BC|nr:hypothetical protein [Kribbella catacumbae]